MMGEKNMKTFVVLALLLVVLSVQASALPDNPPTCSISANTNNAQTTAVLTSVSVDTLANAVQKYSPPPQKCQEQIQV